MQNHRRQLLQLALGALAPLSISGTACADTFPTRPITLIVPFPPGGATDVFFRALAAASEKHLGEPIVIENRAGAGGTLGPSQMVKTAAPDGYTISQIPFTIFREPWIRKTTYDPATDFSFIIGVGAYTFGFVVQIAAPWKTFQEFLADAKARPGKITWGVTGSHGVQSTTMLQIARQLGIDWVSVPFKGDAECINALFGGHVDAISAAATWAPQVDAGQFRLLVLFGEVRSKRWPDVPTLKDVGIDLVASGPYGLAGPKGMDQAVITILHDAFRKGLNEPSVIEVLDQLDQQPWYLNSEEYRSFALKTIEEQKRLVQELGLNDD